MINPRILTTTNSLSAMEIAAAKILKAPVRLILDGDAWRVYKPNITPFGRVNRYFVTRHGTRYRLEARPKIPLPIVSANLKIRSFIP